MQSMVGMMASMSSEGQVPFCSCITECGCLYLDRKMSTLHQRHDCILGKRQNTKNKVWTGYTSCLSPSGSFPSNVFHQPCLYILVPTRESHGPPWLQGAWEGGMTWTPCLPEQIGFLLVQKKDKMDIGKQPTESSKTTAIRWGPAVC